jgi:integrase
LILNNELKRGEKANRECPECHSKEIWKCGFRKTRKGLIQRYLCQICDYRFSESSVLSTNPDNNEGCQVCAYETKVAKNLTKVEPSKNGLAGATTEKTQGDLDCFARHLKKQGKRDTTIKTYTKYIKILAKNGNIFEPEETKLIIATQLKDQNTKRLATYAYDAFLKYIGIKWERPQYRKEDKKVFIPTDEELLLAVNSGTKPSIIFSRLIYETGARLNEAQRVEWTDLDTERNKITIKASKNGNARIVTVSKELLNLLFSMPKNGKTVFPKRSLNSKQANFNRRMKKLARQQNNPRFLKIHYHTFRHCKALREYHKTRSMQHVKRILGHKSIMTTQRYVDTYEELYANLKPENYICETASTIQEAKKLIEQGFEYVSEFEGEQLYRKVK